MVRDLVEGRRSSWRYNIRNTVHQYLVDKIQVTSSWDRSRIQVRGILRCSQVEMSVRGIKNRHHFNETHRCNRRGNTSVRLTMTSDCTTVTPSKSTFPYDIWLYIAHFIPPLVLENLFSVNRVLFHLAMEQRYGQISFAYLSKKMLRLLVRLK